MCTSEYAAGQMAPPSWAEVRDQRMGAAMDGTMIHIDQEGWKELKVGAVFEIAVWPTQDDQTGELVDLAHAVHNSYVAHLGGPEAFGEMVWAEAQRWGWEQAQDTEMGAFQFWGAMSLRAESGMVFAGRSEAIPGMGEIASSQTTPRAMTAPRLKRTPQRRNV